MKIKLIIVYFILSLSIILTQAQNNYPNSPYISVKGQAKKELIPNEIFLSIVIKEKNEAREKISIQSQEEAFKAALKAAEIDANELLIDIENNDSREYILKLKSINEIVQVFAISKKLGVEDTDILRIGHSELPKYIKETQIEAIKNAREKAGYLLTAIDEQIGKTLEVAEGDSSLIISYTITRARNRYDYNRGSKSYNSRETLNHFSFIRINIAVELMAKFEIVKKN